MKLIWLQIYLCTIKKEQTVLDQYPWAPEFITKHTCVESPKSWFAPWLCLFLSLSRLYLTVVQIKTLNIPGS